MEAISCGAITDNAFSTCTPSTICSGELSWVIEPPPRTLTIISAPGAPSEATTCTPANLPCNASAADETGLSFNCLEETEDTEPVRSLLGMLVYPTTTT